MRARAAALVITLVGPLCIAGSSLGRSLASPRQEAREPVTPVQVEAAIDKLGTIDFAVRMDAARTIRRAAAGIAVPALLRAVAEHRDGYVRFRALVVLSGFNDPRTADVMTQALSDPNDRLRTVAYNYFEHNVDHTLAPRLLQALAREESEFVRPALTRTLVAYGADARSDPRVRAAMPGRVMKGQDLFRSAGIEALGDYRASYALGPVSEVAKIDGPLQDDAALALGKIGDKRSLEVLAVLQRTAPRSSQPAIAAAICLLGVNCDSHEGYLADTLRFSIANIGYQDLLRAAANGLAAVAVSGRENAAATLIEQGAPTSDPARAAIALALGTVALRNTSVLIKVLEKQTDLAPAAELLREAFDMLEEDFEEERFFVTVRRTYWQSPENSATRKVTTALIQKLEF
jgi:HEAT repeat protein